MKKVTPTLQYYFGDYWKCNTLWHRITAPAHGMHSINVKCRILQMYSILVILLFKKKSINPS